MKKLHSLNFYLIVFIIISIFLKFFGLIDLSWIKIIAYAGLFWGMSMFYHSYLNQYRNGVFSGAILFQVGVTLFVQSLFELYEPARIFIPAVLILIGTSLLLANLLVKISKFPVVLSIIFIVMGVLLMISRGESTLALFADSTYQLLKQFWIIIVILSIIIIFIGIEFKNGRNNRG